MTRDEIVTVLAAYRRPGSPNCGRHYSRLPDKILLRGNVPVLIDILTDESLPATARDHAAGALGRIGDERAVEFLIDALDDVATRRGAATALGTMREATAREALARVPESVKAARWALGEIGIDGDADSILAALRTGQLRAIRGCVGKLDEPVRGEVGCAVAREFRNALRRGNLGPEHAWLATSLEHLRPAGSTELVAEGLRIALQSPDAWGGVTMRLIRAARRIGGADLISSLLDVTCESDYPPNREQASVAALAVADAAGGEGRRALASHRERLLRETGRYESRIRETPYVAGLKPWDMTPGTDAWAASARRALDAMRRLIAPRTP